MNRNKSDNQCPAPVHHSCEALGVSSLPAGVSTNIKISYVFQFTNANPI